MKNNKQFIELEELLVREQEKYDDIEKNINELSQRENELAAQIRNSEDGSLEQIQKTVAHRNELQQVKEVLSNLNKKKVRLIKDNSRSLHQEIYQASNKEKAAFHEEVEEKYDKKMNALFEEIKEINKQKNDEADEFIADLSSHKRAFYPYLDEEQSHKIEMSDFTFGSGRDFVTKLKEGEID
ncbi:MAG: hypothetical protein L0J35_03980 [Tetragenococcus halophilus]|nr:hypothetical protein [Tetragenococcus halophilus]